MTDDLPIRWLHSDDASFLHWNYRCVAIIRQRGRLWEMEIEWQGKSRRGWDYNRENARSRVERFVRSQPGLPGRATRR